MALHRKCKNTTNVFNTCTVIWNSRAFHWNLFSELWFCSLTGDVTIRMLVIIKGWCGRVSAAQFSVNKFKVANFSESLKVAAFSFHYSSVSTKLKLSRLRGQEREGGLSERRLTSPATAWHLLIHTAEHEEVWLTAYLLSLQCFGVAKPQKQQISWNNLTCLDSSLCLGLLGPAIFNPTLPQESKTLSVFWGVGQPEKAQYYLSTSTPHPCCVHVFPFLSRCSRAAACGLNSSARPSLVAL